MELIWFSVVEVNKMKLFEVVKSLSPYKRNWLIPNRVSLMLIFLIFFKEGQSFVSVIGTCKEKTRITFNHFFATGN